MVLGGVRLEGYFSVFSNLSTNVFTIYSKRIDGLTNRGTSIGSYSSEVWAHCSSFFYYQFCS